MIRLLCLLAVAVIAVAVVAKVVLFLAPFALALIAVVVALGLARRVWDWWEKSEEAEKTS